MASLPASNVNHRGVVAARPDSFPTHAREHEAPPLLYSVDLAECAELADVAIDRIVDRFATTLRDAGATIVQAVSHAFPGRGLTCVLILAESHAILHTWPENGRVNIDIFTCSSRLRSLEAIRSLAEFFAARAVSIQEIPRGASD